MLTTEGQSELVGDLRPKLAPHVETHAFGETVADFPGSRSETPLVPGMIEIAHRDTTCRPEPFRSIEHVSSILSMRYYYMSDSVKKPSWAATVR